MKLKNIVFFTFFFYFILISPQIVKAEKINDFQTDIKINKSGTVSVIEKIVYDFESLYRHGIFRYIPVVWKNSEGKRFKLEHKIIGITDENGAAYNYSTSNTGENIKFQIGDANKKITGIHTYMIKYEVGGAITYFSDHDELYRNITGNDWQVPIEKASVQISLPEAITIENIRTTCYTGSPSSTLTSNCQVEKNPEKTIFSTSSLSVGQGMTVVFGFPKNIVAVLEPKQLTYFSETFIGKIVMKILSFLFISAVLFWYFLYPIWIIIKWFKFGRDPKPITDEVSAWYDPPKTKSGRFLTPIEVGALVDESVDMRDISSMIVDLARRGYFVIEEKKKGDFYFNKKKDFSKDKGLIDFEKKLLENLFSNNDNIRLKDRELVTTVEEIKKMVYEDLVKEGYFPKNPQSTKTFYYVIGGLALFTGNFFLAAVAFIFGRVMPVKTQLGSDSAMVGKSLKNFLSSQERQLEFQAKNQVMFERLLPFAIAFGVERIWANRFKDMAMKSPSWYQGYDNRIFTSYLLVNSLNSSFLTFKSVATPTRSSSGFSSGFSGGFSGGGSGGGGGGSW